MESINNKASDGKYSWFLGCGGVNFYLLAEVKKRGQRWVAIGGEEMAIWASRIWVGRGNDDGSRGDWKNEPTLASHWGGLKKRTQWLGG